jgi:hypothetical protein
MRPTGRDYRDITATMRPLIGRVLTEWEIV